MTAPVLRTKPSRPVQTSVLGPQLVLKLLQMAAAPYRQPVLTSTSCSGTALHELGLFQTRAHLKYGSSRVLRLLKSEVNFDSSHPGIVGEEALQPADTTCRGIASSRAAKSGSMGMSGKGAGRADGCRGGSRPVC